MTLMIHAIRGRLVDSTAKLIETKTCDKGLVIDIISNVTVMLSDGNGYDESELKVKVLELEVVCKQFSSDRNREVYPNFKEHLLSRADVFKPVQGSYQLKYYLLDSIRYDKVSAALNGWIDLSEFRDMLEIKDGVIRLTEGEVLMQAEFKRVINALAFNAGVAFQNINGEYNRIDSDKRAEALRKLKEALAVLETSYEKGE